MWQENMIQKLSCVMQNIQIPNFVHHISEIQKSRIDIGHKADKNKGDFGNAKRNSNLEMPFYIFSES